MSGRSLSFALASFHKNFGGLRADPGRSFDQTFERYRPAGSRQTSGRQRHL